MLTALRSYLLSISLLETGTSPVAGWQGIHTKTSLVSSTKKRIIWKLSKWQPEGANHLLPLLACLSSSEHSRFRHSPGERCFSSRRTNKDKMGDKVNNQKNRTIIGLVSTCWLLHSFTRMCIWKARNLSARNKSVEFLQCSFASSLPQHWDISGIIYDL